MSKQKELSVASLRALEILKANEGALTLAEMKEQFPELNSSNLTALVNRGLVSTEKVEKEVVTTVKRQVNAYTVVATDEPTE